MSSVTDLGQKRSFDGLGAVSCSKSQKLVSASSVKNGALDVLEIAVPSYTLEELFAEAVGPNLYIPDYSQDTESRVQEFSNRFVEAFPAHSTRWTSLLSRMVEVKKLGDSDASYHQVWLKVPLQAAADDDKDFIWLLIGREDMDSYRSSAIAEQSVPGTVSRKFQEIQVFQSIPGEGFSAWTQREILKLRWDTESEATELMTLAAGCAAGRNKLSGPAVHSLYSLLAEDTPQVLIDDAQKKLSYPVHPGVEGTLWKTFNCFLNNAGVFLEAEAGDRWCHSWYMRKGFEPVMVHRLVRWDKGDTITCIPEHLRGAIRSVRAMTIGIFRDYVLTKKPERKAIDAICARYVDYLGESYSEKALTRLVCRVNYLARRDDQFAMKDFFVLDKILLRPLPRRANWEELSVPAKFYRLCQTIIDSAFLLAKDAPKLKVDVAALGINIPSWGGVASANWSYLEYLNALDDRGIPSTLALYS